MAVPCFYCAAIPEAGATVDLSESESRHAAAARRLRSGHRVLLLDGRGGRATGVIEEVSASGVRVSLASREEVEAASPAIAVASALPKGERLRMLLDMLGQLAIASFVPLECEHGVARTGAAGLARGRRVLRESCKQSGNPWFPELREPAPPAAVADTWRGEGVQMLLAHPGAQGAGPGTGRAGAYGLFVGPEGGFTEREVDDLVSRGAVPVALGANILRIETAVVAMVSALRLRRGPFGCA
jgi:16S rRNA (uracil1498-N3)-methyltransferase